MLGCLTGAAAAVAGASWVVQTGLQGHPLACMLHQPQRGICIRGIHNLKYAHSLLLYNRWCGCRMRCLLLSKHSKGIKSGSVTEGILQGVVCCGGKADSRCSTQVRASYCALVIAAGPGQLLGLFVVVMWLLLWDSLRYSQHARFATGRQWHVAFSQYTWQA